jgi:uncharacterized protein
VRIEVGDGLEGILPDAMAWFIIRDRITPRFKEGDYPAASSAGVDGIVEQMRAPLEVAEERALQAARERQRATQGRNTGGGRQRRRWRVDRAADLLGADHCLHHPAGLVRAARPWAQLSPAAGAAWVRSSSGAAAGALAVAAGAGAAEGVLLGGGGRFRRGGGVLGWGRLVRGRRRFGELVMARPDLSLSPGGPGGGQRRRRRGERASAGDDRDGARAHVPTLS